jgi:hypothetical protein
LKTKKIMYVKKTGNVFLGILNFKNFKLGLTSFVLESYFI